MCAKLLQLCLTLFDTMDYSLLGSPAHGILQLRILEWVAIPSSKGIFQTQGLNKALLHCRQILYHLSHLGSPDLLGWTHMLGDEEGANPSKLL